MKGILNEKRIGWITGLLLLVIASSLLAQDTPPPEGLYRVNADGLDIQRLLADPDTIYWGPGWSHHGTHIAVTVSAVGEIDRLPHHAASLKTMLQRTVAEGKNLPPLVLNLGRVGQPDCLMYLGDPVAISGGQTQ